MVSMVFSVVEWKCIDATVTELLLPRTRKRSLTAFEGGVHHMPMTEETTLNGHLQYHGEVDG